MRLHILLVEDDRTKCASVLRVLEESGIDVDDVVQAGDAKKARALLEYNRFDVMILDIALPETPTSEVSVDAGLGLLEELLEHDRLLVPRQVVGISGVEEVLERASESFNTHGCMFVKYSASEGEWRAPLRSVVENARRSLIPGDEGYRSHAVIVCALSDPELAAVLKNGWSWNPHVIQGDDTQYFKAELPDGQLVFAAAASRMGTEASAVLAAKAIQHFRPKYIAMCGIAAGVSDRTNYGDVLVADPSWNWGSGKWKVDKDTKERQFAPDPHHLTLDVGLRSIVEKLAADKAWLASVKSEWSAKPPDTELAIKVGPVASGPSVLADGEGIKRILKQHRKLIGVEMEAYAVFMTACQYTRHRPTPIVAKSVVDHADTEKGDDFQHYGSFTSARVLARILELAET